MGSPRRCGAAAWAAEGPARIDAAGLGRYAPEVESTVYFCCAAALEDAGPATVRVWHEDGWLAFEVVCEQQGRDLSSPARPRRCARWARHDRCDPGGGTRLSGMLRV